MHNSTLHKFVSVMTIGTLLSSQLGCQQVKNTVNAIVNPDPSKEREKAKEKPVILCLFDISGSTNSPALRDLYIAQFNTIGRSIPVGSHLMAATISDNSWSTPGRSIDLKFPVYDSKISNEFHYRKDLNKKRKQAQAMVSEMIRTATGKENTDLLETMLTAEKLLMGEKHGKSKDKRLIVFSDMISQTGEYDFSGAWKWPKSKNQQIIEELKGSGRFPSLEGVNVWIVGAGRTAGGGVAPKITNKVMTFWLEYFQSAKANTSKFRYGSELFNYPDQEF